MKFLITENKIYKVLSHYMSDKFDNLKPYKSRIFPVGRFYLNDIGGIESEVIDKVQGVILDYNLWVEIADLFLFQSIREQSDALEYWAKEYFGFESPLIDFREFMETIEDL
jgi:hypothetical protein